MLETGQPSPIVPEEEKKESTPEIALDVNQVEADINAYLHAIDVLDKRDDKVITQMEKNPNEMFTRDGINAENVLEEAMQMIQEQKNGIFKIFRHAPDSMDLFDAKMDFVVVLNTGQVLGIQLKLIFDEDAAEANTDLREKRIDATKYGIQEPKEFKGVTRKLVDLQDKNEINKNKTRLAEIIQENPKLAGFDYATRQYEFPRGVAYVRPNEINGFNDADEEDKIKRAAVLAAQMVDSLIEDLDPVNRVALAKKFGLPELDQKTQATLQEYVNSLNSISFGPK